MLELVSCIDVSCNDNDPNMKTCLPSRRIRSLYLEKKMCTVDILKLTTATNFGKLKIYSTKNSRYSNDVFSLFVSSYLGGGVPRPRSEWGGVYPIPGLDGEGTQFQVWMVGGVPHPVMVVGGTPSIHGGGGYPIQSWWGVPRIPPGQVWMGTPHHDWMGHPHHHDWMRNPPPPWLDGIPLTMTGWDTLFPPIRQSSMASTCYAAGSMPLAFTQEDFLVEFSISYWVFCPNDSRDKRCGKKEIFEKVF